MKTPPPAISVCSKCGRRLNANGECLPCLMRIGFDQPAAESISPIFGDFEVVLREDGSFWELGHGAMGTTYWARDTVLNRNVAIKVVSIPDATTNAQSVRDRFLWEARAAAAFRHPNVAGVFHFGTAPDGSGCYYAMELVEGETLEALVRRDGPLKIEVALEIAAQVTRALIAAAEQGLVHRDLKPGNIMLTRAADLEVKVIDFGLARAVAETGNEMDLTHGAFVGTPAFASPEQFRGAQADARSDIYSLGVTLWYALTGDVPFEGKTIEDIRRCQSDLPLPLEKLSARKIPPPVIQLLRRILAAEPTQRPSSARELMEVLESCRTRLGLIPVRKAKAKQSGRKLALLMGMISIGLAALVGLRAWRTKSPVALPVSEKSIAVLPFKNLSADAKNAFFAEGMQDDIRTALAKIADLKVISRTSVMQYGNSDARNLREIGQQLGVAHVLEGSVQRADKKVRVTAQLVDTRDDTCLWAHTYDRDLADVFAIQSDIAKTIAEQLQAQLPPLEKAAITQARTRDMVANDLYVRARALDDKANNPGAKQYLLQGIDLLEEAVRRDPEFVAAYCLMCETHLDLYWYGFDHTTARREQARAALERAERIEPDAGEVHAQRGIFAYHCFRDYATAQREFEIARQTSPNSSRLYLYLGSVNRRQARWDDALKNFDRAMELDPRNFVITEETGFTYAGVGLTAEAEKLLKRAVELSPKDHLARIAVAQYPYFIHADLGPLRQQLNLFREEGAEATSNAAETFIACALAGRDRTAAEQALTYVPEEGVVNDFENFQIPRGWLVGLVARTFGDNDRAQSAFAAARVIINKIVQEQPDYAPAWSMLGLLDAGLGHKAEAMAEGKRACELLPLSKDSWEGPLYVVNLAIICSWLGEKDLALEQLALSVNNSGGINHGELKLQPFWDPLRADPRFQKLLAATAPEAGQF